MALVNAGISAATGGSCAAAATVLWVAGRVPKLSHWVSKLQGPRVELLLILTASVAVMSTPIGHWWNSWITGVNGWAAGLVGGWTGLVVTPILALIALVVLVGDFLHQRMNARTLALAILVPILAATIPGAIGRGITSGLSAITSIVGRLIGAMFGAG